MSCQDKLLEDREKKRQLREEEFQKRREKESEANWTPSTCAAFAASSASIEVTRWQMPRFLNVVDFLPCSHCSDNAGCDGSATFAVWRMDASQRISYMVNLPVAREVMAAPNCASKMQMAQCPPQAAENRRGKDPCHSHWQESQAENKHSHNHLFHPYLQPMRPSLPLTHWTRQPQPTLSLRLNLTFSGLAQYPQLYLLTEGYYYYCVVRLRRVWILCLLLQRHHCGEWLCWVCSKRCQGQSSNEMQSCSQGHCNLGLNWPQRPASPVAKDLSAQRIRVCCSRCLQAFYDYQCCNVFFCMVLGPCLTSYVLI